MKSDLFRLQDPLQNFVPDILRINKIKIYCVKYKMGHDISLPNKR